MSTIQDIIKKLRQNGKIHSDGYMYDEDLYKVALAWIDENIKKSKEYDDEDIGKLFDLQNEIQIVMKAEAEKKRYW